MQYPLSPVMFVTLLFALGIAAGDNNYLHGSCGFALVAGALAVAVALFFVCCRRARWRWTMAALCVMAFVGGWVADRACWSGIQERQAKVAQLAPRLNHAAVITTQPMPHSKVSTMTVELDDGTRVQLSVPHGLVATDSLCIGQQIVFKGRIKAVEAKGGKGINSLNSLGDKFALYLLRGKVTARAYATELRIIAEPRNPLMRLRRAIQRRIGTLPLDGNSQALLRALLIADRSHLGNGLRDDFRDAGVSHLLALSGMHLSVVVGLLVLLFGHDVRDRWRNFVCISAIVWCYVMVAGCPASLSRAAWFCTLMLLCSAMRRHVMLFDNLWATALVMLIASPHSLFDAGLQLSFAAIAAIALAYWLWPGVMSPRLHGQGRDVLDCLRLFAVRKLYALRSALTLGLACTLATMPISLLSFGRFSLYGTLSTVLMSPITLAIIVLALPALVLPDGLLANLLCDVLDLLCSLLALLGHAFASLPQV